MTKFTLLDSLRMDSDARTKFDYLSNTTRPTLLESLSQDYDSLEIDNELLSNTSSSSKKI